MNAKLLFAATVIVSAIASLASTAALADDNTAPLTRAQVVEQLNLARATGTLQRTEYDFSVDRTVRSSALTRAEVIAALSVKRSPLLVGPLANESYNPTGTEYLIPSTTPRAQVKAETLEAIANGTLLRSDADFDQAQVARGSHAPAAKPTLARLFRGSAG